MHAVVWERSGERRAAIRNQSSKPVAMPVIGGMEETCGRRLSGLKPRPPVAAEVVVGVGEFAPAGVLAGRGSGVDVAVVDEAEDAEIRRGRVELLRLATPGVGRVAKVERIGGSGVGRHGQSIATAY